MELTNVVSMSLSRQLSVCDCGSRIASMIRSSMPTISAFFTHEQIGRITRPAQWLTLGCVSKTHSKNAGKISGRFRMKYAGTRLARSPHTVSAPHFACHVLCVIASTSAGAKSFIAVSGNALTTAACAASAASLTSGLWSPCAMNIFDARSIANGSNARPAVRHRCA
eukprot:31060-Pelagococcus_subviridis.AAC.8